MDDQNSATDVVRRIKDEVARATSSVEVANFARGMINDAADRTAAAFKTAVRPIWGVNKQLHPVSRGSCVLLEIGAERFILTAAHVADFIRDSVLYIGLDRLELLPNTFETTIAPDGCRNRDTMDFAIMRFPPGLMTKLGEATFIPEISIGVGERIEKRTFTCLGYPTKMNMPSRTQPNMVRGKLMSHTSRGRLSSTLPGIAVNGTHILVDRHAKHARNSAGLKVGAFSGNGMSGGGIFDVGELGSPTSIFMPEPPRIAAITTEGFSSQKVIMGTRIDAIIRGLKRQNWL